MVKIRSVDSVKLNTSISKLQGNKIVKVCGNNMYAFVPKNLKKIAIRTVVFT
jgi:ABC-type Zn2+ transport system substrate-binding protein/surface adhesin